MIYDNLANFRRYAGIAPEYWVRAFTFLEQLTPTTPEGRYELEGDRLYLLVQRYEVQPDSSHPAEVHRRYLDVQLPVVVLPCLCPSAVEAVPFQVVVEPGGDEVAPAPHEVDFFFRDAYRFECLYLPGELAGEPFGVGGAVAVGEGVFHLRTGKVVDDRAAHGELV